MKDYRDPKERQKFLQENIDRHLNKKTVKKEEKQHSFYADNRLMARLIDFFENAAEAEYRALSRRLKNRNKLRLI